MIELSLPAGNLEVGIQAFLGGADSVYFGLKEFSARKGAENFSIEDFRKIRKYALDNNKKIYITINTLVKDDEIKRVFNILSEIAKYGCDGIIVQDLGIIKILRDYFPSLKIHASTQLAVHTDYGVKMLKALGAERVVLSRELDLEEIEKIRSSNPDIEIKVFIHGAMCYGFSGLCMASLYKTGRSANRGECAQICRTWFEKDGKKLFPFSMKDMNAGYNILDLERIGIDSVKVEGRMKGCEYAYYTALYYRSILDHKGPRDEYCYTFLRENGPGYLNYSGPGHFNLITEKYTSHIGKEVAKVISQKGRKVELETLEDIKEHDGLMVVEKDNNAYKFSAKMAGKNTILLDSDKTLSYGTKIYKISDSKLNLKKINTSSLKEEREKIDAAITLSDSTLTIESESFKKSYDVFTEKGKENKDAVIKALEQSSLDKELKIVKYENPLALYLSLKDAKRARRDYLSLLEDKKVEMPEFQCKKEERIRLPDRSLLSSKVFPWNEEGVVIDGALYITLSAITFREEEKYSLLLKKLKRPKRNPPIYIGLNNIADLYFAKEHPEFNYFLDIYFYASNKYSIALVKEVLGDSLKGLYLPPDADTFDDSWPLSPSPLGSYKLPLFISRSCFRHDSLKKDCEGCIKHHSYKIEQNGKSYSVFVENCMTVVKE